MKNDSKSRDKHHHLTLFQKECQVHGKDYMKDEEFHVIIEEGDLDGDDVLD